MAKKKSWSHKVGKRGVRVVVRERTFGSNVRIGAQDPKINGTRWRSLGFRVRDAEGELIPEALERAETEARRLSNLLGSPAPEPPPEPVEPTMAEVIAQFELSVVPGLRGKHRQETERQVKLLGRVLGAKKAIDIGGDDWLRLQWMIMSGAIDARGNPVPEGKRRPVGQRTAAKVLKTLRHICRHAQTVRRDGRPLLRFDPTVGLEVPTNSDPAQPVCDDQTYEKLRDATKSHRVRLVGRKRPSPMPVLLTLAAETGRRIGAIVALRWEDWNPDAGTFGTLTWRADADKLRRTTTTPVTPDVRKALEEHRLETSGIGEGWIFPAPRGRGHVTVSVVGRWLKACETAAEISHQKGFGWHALRRAFATKRKGMSIQDVAALGGWKGTQVLQDLYQRADLDAMERVLLEGQKVRLRSVR